MVSKGSGLELTVTGTVSSDSISAREPNWIMVSEMAGAGKESRAGTITVLIEELERWDLQTSDREGGGIEAKGGNWWGERGEAESGGSRGGERGEHFQRLKTIVARRKHDQEAPSRIALRSVSKRS